MSIGFTVNVTFVGTIKYKWITIKGVTYMLYEEIKVKSKATD